jgi:hypothetical protein
VRLDYTKFGLYKSRDIEKSVNIKSQDRALSASAFPF